jgi:hypothetical protein
VLRHYEDVCTNYKQESKSFLKKVNLPKKNISRVGFGWQQDVAVV